MPTHLFRNVRISSIHGTVQEAGPIVRLHVRSEIMPDVAEHMQWQAIQEGSLVGGINSASLAGAIACKKAKLQPNGMKEHNIEVDCIEARDFKIATKGKTSESDGESELQFVISFPQSAMEALMVYWMNVGGADAVVRLQDAGKQEGLFGDKEEGDKETAGEKGKDGPALASVTEMGSNRRGPKKQ